MTPVEIDNALESMKIIVDTREQDTFRSRARYRHFGCPYIRQKLDYGDYSVTYTTDGEKWLNGADFVAVERKMSLDELASCFTTGRGRFEREFKRAAENNVSIHLVVENGSYEKLYNGEYRSRLNSKSFMASLMSWQSRYNIKIHFCTPNTTPKLIGDILRYELREHLKNAEI